MCGMALPRNERVNINIDTRIKILKTKHLGSPHTEIACLNLNFSFFKVHCVHVCSLFSTLSFLFRDFVFMSRSLNEPTGGNKPSTF